MIQPISATDQPWVLALNTEFEAELSPLDAAGLSALVDSAVYARQAEGGAFLVAFDQTGAYDSPNFLWFRVRFAEFLYVDRIAVAATHHRRGLARALYDDLFAFARAKGYPRVVAEVNSDPPNLASDAFHLSLGFEVIGERRLEGRGKTVRYFEAAL